MKKFLVTGGCGFIGSNFVRYLHHEYPDYGILNFDKLTYAGNRDSLKDIEGRPGYQFIKGDIADFNHVASVIDKMDCVVHFAAESHVDRSIQDPSVFVKTNVDGTYNLLECALRAGVTKFIHISTDEVYGSLDLRGDGRFTEETPLSANSPYSASKAASDLLARSYFKTYGFPVMITRCSNNYGPYQYPEKLIPLMITNALEGKPLPVYGDGLNVRDWIYVEDHCRAIDLVLHKGKPGEIYNIGGSNEWHNIDLVKLILKRLGKPQSLIRFVKDRLGHDRRYALDTAKIRKSLGWAPEILFEDGIQRTIQWYLKNKEWIRRVKAREKRLLGKTFADSVDVG